MRDNERLGETGGVNSLRGQPGEVSTHGTLVGYGSLPLLSGRPCTLPDLAQIS